MECDKLEVRETAMATRTIAPAERKLSKKEAAEKIASLVELAMTESGFSEQEKNVRVQRFGQRVDKATRRSAKR
jgi:hypothetical protein